MQNAKANPLPRQRLSAAGDHVDGGLDDCTVLWASVRLIVHAKDDQAKGFHEHFNFEPSSSDAYHLVTL
jgi:hypothetical protein